MLRDVRNELVGAAAAREQYGVVVDVATWSVDAAATQALRGSLRAARNGEALPRIERGPTPDTPDIAA